MATVVRSVDTRKRQVYVGRRGTVTVRASSAAEAMELLADE